MMVTSLPSPAASRAVPAGRGAVPSTWKSLLHEIEWAAQEPLVNTGHGYQRIEQRRQPLPIEPAAENLDVLSLAREHVDNFESFGIAVLQVQQLFEEHDAAGRAVGVNQRHRAVRLDLEDGVHE
jgi:hypothetical protein